MEVEKRVQVPSALDIQRRLELKEFFLAKDDRLNAALVDNMFKIATFSELRANVEKVHGDLPENWKNEGIDRYAKYKRMAEKGMGKKKIMKEMERDGIDPEEFGWNDEMTRDIKRRLSTVSTGKEKVKMVRELKRTGSRGFMGKMKRKKKTSSNQKIGVGMDMQDFELQREINHLKAFSSARSKSTTTTNGSDDKKKVKTIRKRFKGRRRPDVVVPHRSRLVSLNSSGENIMKKGEHNHPLEDAASLGESDDEYGLDPADRNKFLYSAREVEEEEEERIRCRKKSHTVSQTEMAEIAKLTKTKQVGHIHDFIPFFTKTKDSLRKASAQNIGRKVSSMIAAKKKTGRNLKGSIIFTEDFEPTEEVERLSSSRRRGYASDEESEDEPPVAPPRTRRTKVPGRKATISDIVDENFNPIETEPLGSNSRRGHEHEKIDHKENKRQEKKPRMPPRSRTKVPGRKATMTDIVDDNFNPTEETEPLGSGSRRGHASDGESEHENNTSGEIKPPVPPRARRTKVPGRKATIVDIL